MLTTTSLKNIWSKIPPFWPLKNIIAVNPLLGFDDLPFEEALQQGASYFQKKNFPEEMKCVNRETIKWLQLYSDQGQASIAMPLREMGFLKAMLTLLPFDKKICSKTDLEFLTEGSASPEEILAKSLLKLNIPEKRAEEFLTLMLTTLPGWAAYIHYLNEWCDKTAHQSETIIDESEYLTFRVLLTALLWPNAQNLLNWNHHKEKSDRLDLIIQKIEKEEERYQTSLLSTIKTEDQEPLAAQKAQLVFCIDVRSEPFRRALEMQGNYETFGFAGFFGIPLGIENKMTGEHYASCPVLIKPKHKIVEALPTSDKQNHDLYKKVSLTKRLFQSIKYNFTTPFALVEILGFFAGVWVFIRTFFPQFAYLLKTKFNHSAHSLRKTELIIDSISLEDRCKYASAVLHSIGLIENFAPLIVFCGHGSQTQNNSHATALDCGACGGRPGSPNARVLATILNDPRVRKSLAQEGIVISDQTLFLAGLHNTTTDQLDLYDDEVATNFSSKIEELKKDLELARIQNTQWRCSKLGEKYSPNEALKHSLVRANDWAQVRPEWGLATNASMIIGPRSLTRGSDLHGRSFLHSYDYRIDPEGKILETILTAPMIVGYWINTQYFFSTLDNVAYGTGSKITKNITGKIGVMQGNGSDLMNGLPLQSVNRSDTENYHELLRLLTVVYAPRSVITKIIEQHEILQKLFFNGWVKLACIDPEEKTTSLLQRDKTWKTISHSLSS